MIPERVTLCPVNHLNDRSSTSVGGDSSEKPKYNNITFNEWIKDTRIDSTLHHVARTSVRNNGTSVHEEKTCTLDCRDDTEEVDVPEVYLDCKPASLSAFSRMESRLCIYHNDHEVYLCTGSADYYLVDDLRNLSHSFENGSTLPNGMSSTRTLTIVPPVAEAITDQFTIVRDGGASGYFNKHFGDLNVNFSKILWFVRTFGYANASRDGVSGDEVPCRIDFGCAGDGSERRSDGSTLRPYLTCGMDIFDDLSDDDRTEIKYYHAAIMDRMQLIHDDIEMSALHNDRPYNFSPRTTEYGCAVRQAVGASLCRMEWMTTQAKNVSVSERTEEHKDERNCTWKGYTKTAGLCVMLQSRSTKTVYSLKFIANSRSRVGKYYGDHMVMNPIITRIRYHVEKIDQEYALMHKKQLGNRSHDESVHSVNSDLYLKTPTHQTYFNVILDKWSPWISTKIGHIPGNQGDVMADVIKVPANITRYFFLSPACTLIYQLKKHLETRNNVESKESLEDKLIETAVICGYQTSMIRPFYVAHKRIADLDCNHPSMRLYSMLLEQFGSLTGSCGCKRLNPTGVNFQETYMREKRIVVDDILFEDKHKEMNGVMSVVVTHIKKLMDTLNKIIQSESFHHDKVEEVFKETCDVWKSMDVDIGEFRLMIIVQVSVGDILIE